MLNKLYEKIKSYIKQNYKFLLTLITMYIVLTLPLPYYIYTTGGTIDINDRVTIENAYNSKGSFNFAYVSELRATLSTYLLSVIIPSWETVKIEDYKLSEKETIEDVNFRDKVSLEEANQSAVKVAFNQAGKTVNITNYHHYIVYVDSKSNTDLKVGDEILQLDNKNIETLEEYKNIVNSHNISDKLDVKIKRNNKELIKSIEVIDIEGKKLTGLSITTIYDFETLPKIKFNFAKSESGPSGGLMLALSIYNKLIKEDITYGKKIVGTGTVSEDGSVGAIGGVEYKLRGAVKDKADLFLVPAGENYNDCIKLKEAENLDITIIGVETFIDALNALHTLE